MTPEEGIRAEDCDPSAHPCTLTRLLSHGVSTAVPAQEQSIPADQPHGPGNAQERVLKRDYKGTEQKCSNAFPGIPSRLSATYKFAVLAVKSTPWYSTAFDSLA